MRLSFTPLLNYDISAGVGSVIGGGASLLGDIFNLFGSSKANREQRAYNTSIMQTQRNWALEDIANQNAYNSPVQQMARYKEAGLNPNLIYGEGTTASSGQSDQPRSVSSPSYNPENTLSSFSNLGAQTMNAINTGQNIKMNTQSLENMKAEKLNKDADTFIKEKTGNILSTEPGATDTYEYDSNNQPIGKGSTEHTQELKQALFAAQNASSITEAVQKGLQSILQTTTDKKIIDKITEEIKSLKNNQKLQKLDIESQSWDLNANSPVWQQVIGKILTALFSHFTK